MSNSCKTNVIGVLVPSITNLFFPLVINGIQNYLQPLGYSLLLSVTNDSADQQIERCEEMFSRNVDGIIAVDPLPENGAYFEEISQEVPLVMVNGFNKGIQCHFVLHDHIGGAEKALAYLLSLGHKNIGFIRAVRSYSFDTKEKVYYSMMREHHLEILPSNMIIVTSANSIETSEMTAKAVVTRLQESNPPTAFFACNDWMAVGTLNAAKRLGLSVPEDISIIGYDNIVITELSYPKMTTIDQHGSNLGEESAKLVCRLISQPSETFVTVNVKDPSLVIRETCMRINN